MNPTGYPQVFDETVNGLVTRTYTYGLQRINENQTISGTRTPSFYVYEGGGSVRQLTNLAGTVTDTYSYDAFGNLLNSTGTTPNNYLYRGEQYDPDLSLYYLRARYYNPATGRFLSRDPNDPKPLGPKRVPSEPKKLHKYLYAGGDPANRIDPTGRDFEESGELDEQAIRDAEELKDLNRSVRFDLCVEDTVIKLTQELWDYSDEDILSIAIAKCAGVDTY